MVRNRNLNFNKNEDAAQTYDFANWKKNNRQIDQVSGYVVQKEGFQNMVKS